MNGIIVINKDKNYTSRDVVNIVSKKLKTKKVGHTGTLDPMATGVLVVCVNEGTKLVDLLSAHTKEYIAEVTLGISTDTLDITGDILKEEDVIIDEHVIIDALNNFPKKYMQEVPIYSAVKVNGKKLYEYAREGNSVVLPKKEVSIYNLELVNNIKYKNNKTIFKIKCLVSKGTYIRSLIKDISNSLNTIGTMSDLVRIKNGTFDIKDSFTIQEFENGNYHFISLEEAIKNIQKKEVDDILLKKISNGCKINNIYDTNLLAFTKNNKVIAIYESDGNYLKPYKMFLKNI